MRQIIFLLPLLPTCFGIIWLWGRKPFKLTKDNADFCDFESSDCDVTYYQASDWFRGHEHKWIRWFRLQVTDLISNSFSDFFRFPPTVEWLRLSGSNVSEGQAAPLVDHTSSSPEGHYMFLDPDINDGYSLSVLLQTRQYYTVNPHVCFRFWYQIRGEATMMLATVIKNDSGQEVKIVQPNSLYSGDTNRAIDWKEAVHTLDVPVRKAFKIAIMGGVRDRQQGTDVDSIAVDDLQVKVGRCRQSRSKPRSMKHKHLRRTSVSES